MEYILKSMLQFGSKSLDKHFPNLKLLKVIRLNRLRFDEPLGVSSTCLRMRPSWSSQRAFAVVVVVVVVPDNVLVKSRKYRARHPLKHGMPKRLWLTIS